MISQEILKSKLRYDFETGEFFWKVPVRGIKPNSQAGSINDQGYLCIRIDGILYRAQRLAWLYVYGCWPEGVIDHIDGARLNNVISNLRDVSKSENQKNLGKNKRNKSGETGIMWYPPLQKWHVQIQHAGKRIHIGYYSDFNDAILHRNNAHVSYGFHNNHGNRGSWNEGET